MSEPRGQLRKEHLTFPGCSHFRRLDDNHEKCQSCMYGGAPGCTRLSRCHFCADWTSSMWDAEEKNRQAAVKRCIRKKDKKASASSTGEPMRPGHESSSEVFSSRNPSPAHSRTSGYSGKGPSPKVHSRDETRVERGRSPSRGRHGVDEERIELVRSPAKAPRHEVRVERVRSPSPVCHERMEPFCSPSVTRGQERSPGVDTLLDYDEKGLSDDDFIGYDDFPKGFSGSSPEHSCEDDELLASPPRPHLTPLPVDSPKDNPGRVSFAIGKRRVPRGPYPLVMVSPVGLGRAIRVLLRPLVMRTVVGCDVPGVRRCPPLIRKVLSGWTRIMSRTWILCYGIPARLWTRMERTSRWWVRTYRPSRCWFPRFLSWTHLLLRPVCQGSRHQILNLPWGNLWIWWSLPSPSPWQANGLQWLQLQVLRHFSHDSRRNSRSRSRSPLMTESSSRRTSRSARSRRERRHSQSSTSRQRVSDDDGSDIMVSPSRYSIFRNAVRTSRGAYTSVNPRGEGLAKASMVHLSQDDKPEKVAWSVQPQLRHAIDHVSMLAQGVKKIDKVAKTPLCEHTSRESSFKFLKPNEVFDRKENFRLKVDPDSDFPIKPPHLDGSLGSFTMPASFNVPAACVSASEELSRRAAVYGSIADVMFSSIIHSLAPEDKRAPLLKERITIAAEASMRSITASVAVASNMQLVRRDVVLDHLLLNQSSASRARTAPFSGTHLMGPDPNRFYEEIMKLREQQVLHGGLSANFRIPQHLVLLSPGLCGIVPKPTTDLEVLVPGGGSPFVGPPQLLDRVNSRDSPINSEDNLSSNKEEEDSPGEVAEVVPTGMNLRLEDLPLPLVIETLRVGARLTNFVQQWQNLLGDCRASRTLGNGVQLEWESLPPLTRTPISFNTRNTPKDLQTAVDKLLSKGAIEPVFRPETKGFFSRLFLVPKKTGFTSCHRSLPLDHLVIPRFKMETQASVRASIKKNEWTVSIDIQDAYLHVPMARSVRKYLRFMVNGRVYQFTCLPFGLATSPREFTKLLRPVVQLLRLQGIKLHVYLDDWLIRASSTVQARTHADLVLQVLQHLGWVIIFSKSDLVPSQQFDFIGMQFNTCAYTVAPLPRMRVKIQNTLDHWRSYPLISARDLHRLLGMLTFMATLVPRGRLRLRPIQWWASEIWCQETGCWSDRISVTPTILHQVAWWASPAVLQGVSLSALETEITLFTDASSHGWGAQLGSRTLQGTWSPQQASQHINLLEMEAVFLSVTRFLPQLKSRVVRLMCDNAVVVSYINKEGGTKSFRLTRLTIRLLKFCDRKGIRLVPVHLPGSRNIQADALSRVGQTLATEWAINGQLLHPVFSAWGTPVIDLFATFANRKLPVFASPFPDQRAKYVDAMSVPWSGMGMVYAFPPFKMLPAVLNKIRRSHNLSVILIAPRLMSASWMPELLEQSRCPPIPLDGHPLLTQEVRLPRGHVETRHYRPSNLHAWLLWKVCLSSSVTAGA